MHNIKDSSENYLETIYRLSKTQEKVRSIDLSKFLEISKPSVSNGIKKLKEKQLIRLNLDGTIILTEEGYLIAKSIYNKHILIRDFLIKIGVDPDVADDDACKMEHVISEQSFNKLKDYLTAIKESK